MGLRSLEIFFTLKVRPHQTPRRALKKGYAVLFIIARVHCKLRRAGPRHEIKAGKSLSFTAPRFFSVALWPITLAKRVMCRKKTYHA